MEIDGPRLRLLGKTVDISNLQAIPFNRLLHRVMAEATTRQQSSWHATRSGLYQNRKRIAL